MEAAIRSAIEGQFGAAIDMLENAMVACPEELWGDRSRRPEFWYLVYHTLFFLDFYLSDSPEGFAPPAPFTLDELDPAGIFPERVYAKAELQAYLRHGRAKLGSVLGALTDASARERHGFRPFEGTRMELLLYNLRHVQHHAAQLYLVLRRETDSAPRWVSRSRVPGGAG